MDREKEIEELRQVIAEYSCNRKCTESCERRGYCTVKSFVTNIIDVGYRKVDVVCKETAKEILKLIKDCRSIHLEKLKNNENELINSEISIAFLAVMKTIGKKFSVEVDA